MGNIMKNSDGMITLGKQFDDHDTCLYVVLLHKR